MTEAKTLVEYNPLCAVCLKRRVVLVPREIALDLRLLDELAGGMRTCAACLRGMASSPEVSR